MKKRKRGVARVLKTAEVEQKDRYREDLGDLEELADSIEKKGLIQPIVVERDGDRHFILCGGRRHAAHVLRSIPEIQAIVHKSEDLTDFDRRDIELEENIKRKDMTWDERAKLVQEVHRLYVEEFGEPDSPTDTEGHTQKDTAERLGLNRETVRKDLELAEVLETDPDVVAGAKTRDEAVKKVQRAKEDLINSEIAKRREEALPSNTIEKSLLNCYYVEDFFVKATKMPENAFQVAEIDPPYGIDLHGQKKDQDVEMMGEYNEVGKGDYPDFLDRTMKEVSRILQTSSWVIHWCAFEWQDVVKEILKKYEFTPATIPAAWVKMGGSGGNNQPDINLTSSYELFIYARRGTATLAKQGLKNTFSYKPVYAGDKAHPTERPIEMIQEVLERFTRSHESVLVPFLGSGNTILAAANMGVQAIGCDLSAVHRDRFVAKATGQEFGKYRSYKQEED